MGVRGTRDKPKKKKFTHRELCFDLAEAKGTRFIEVPLGSKYLSWGEVSQADVVTIKPSYNRFNLDIYEVKVSRADFLGEIRKKKYEASLPHCNRFYFAVLQGVCKAEEIPEGLGLIVRGENGWSTVKAAKKRNINFEQNTLLSLLFFNGRVFNKRRVDLSRNHYIHIHTWDRDRLKGFSKRIKDALVNYNRLERQFQNLLYEASKKISFTNHKAQEDFEDKWEKKMKGESWW